MSDTNPVTGPVEVAVPPNNAINTRGRPFPKGNPGRPRGARNKTSLAVESLIDGQHGPLVQKAISLALAGDVTALKICLDRLAPLRRDVPVFLDLPNVDSAEDAVQASSVVIGALSAGEVSPSEAIAVLGVLNAHLKIIAAANLEVRVQRLENNGRPRVADMTPGEISEHVAELFRAAMEAMHEPGVPGQSSDNR